MSANTEKEVSILIKKCFQSSLTGLLILSLLFLQNPISTFVQAADEAENLPIASKTDTITYSEYLKNIKSFGKPDICVPVDILNFASSSNYALIKTSNDDKKYVATSSDGYIEWKINVLNEGLYNIKLDYFPVEGKGSDIVRSLYIDGALPFDQARSLYFKRSYTNEYPVFTKADEQISRTFKKDELGNEIRPSQIEQPALMSVFLTDIQGYNTKPYLFYFSAGEHSIKFESIKEPLGIYGIELCQSTMPEKYNVVAATYPSDTAQNQYIEIQGEYASQKSDMMVYPTSDMSSPETVPSSANKIILNTIGGNKWQNNMQWISWEFDVPQTGQYQLGIKARQNIVNGQSVFRRIYIDDKIPFEEMDAVAFSYSSQWKTVVPGEKDDPYLFFLTKGTHTIKMEVTLGTYAEFANDLDNILSELTSIYTSFLMLIGPSPDVNRDYHFEKLYSEQIELLHTQAVRLKEMYNQYILISGSRGQQAQILYNMAKLMEKMYKNPHKIASLFSSFNSNISSIATLLATVKQQPLEIDYIAFTSTEKAFKKAESGFFNSVFFAAKRFFYSFSTDYTSIGAEKTKGITIWLGNGGAANSGRDQANVLYQMIKNDFTAKKHIDVDLQLVPVGSLLTATLAGKGPDVALTLGQSEPMNYAIRGAAEDLTQFENFQEVKKRFESSAMTPLTFMNKVYGLPETQSFPVMFYRKDILEQFNITVPQTWEDVVRIIPILQTKNLQFGLQLPYVVNAVGSGFSPFVTFLYQNDGELYDESGSKCLLNSKNAVNSFFQWTEFYTNYGIPDQYDFLTRFRFGEMPICIGDYGQYNALSVFAPELDGKWSFALVPGTEKDDGSINRTVASTINACMMLSNCKDKESAWRFMDWWTTAKVQQQFGREIESIMGTASRYQTANVEALYQIPWNASDFQLLRQQQQYTKGIPEVPGSYITPRYVDFAFKQVAVASGSVGISTSTDPGQILIDISKLVDSELNERRNEFGFTD